MEEPKEPINTGKNVVIRNPDGTIKSGSLNPKGKPVGARHMTTLLKEAIVRIAEEDGTSDDKEIVKTLVERAKRGDMKAIEMIFDRIEGKPLERREEERREFKLEDKYIKSDGSDISKREPLGISDENKDS